MCLCVFVGCAVAVSGMASVASVNLSVDPAFQVAGLGQSPGIRVWRIEDFKPVEWPQEQYGIFYSGDSYIVLETAERRNRLLQTIYFWLGRDSSQDEKGTAAYKTFELSQALGGEPQQHREVQDHESEGFISVFKPAGIRYLDGGVESGFKSSARVHEPRLFWVKGRRNVRVLQVSKVASSLNHGDAFLLDLEDCLYVWVGNQANPMEKFKAVQVAEKIRDDERGGKCQIVVLQDGVSDDVPPFWESLGGSPQDVTSAESAGEDSAFEQQESSKLFSVSGEGSDITAVENFQQDSLTDDGCFILDAGSEVYVWVGKNSSPEQKRGSMVIAEKFLSEQGRPSWTQVTRVFSGNEPELFRSKFPGWRVAIPNFVREPEKRAQMPDPEVDIEAMIRGDLLNTASQTPDFDDGSGTVKVFRINKFEREAVPEEEFGCFFSGDSYIVQYTYMTRNREEYLLYYWLGKFSTQDETAACAFQVVKMDDELNGRATQIRVTQGKEPDHFLKLFRGRFVCFSGGAPSAFGDGRELQEAQYDPNGIALFHVKGTSDLNTKAVQVAAVAASLNSGDSFVLQQADGLLLWNGNLSLPEEREFALKASAVLKKPIKAEIQEGEEPEEFWEALGGRGEYATERDLVGDHEIRLFHVSDKAGYVQVEEIFNFTQEDLFDDDVMLLDAWSTVYIWIGSQSNQRERTQGAEIGEKYIRELKGREPTLVTVKAGQEPLPFTAHFLNWDHSKSAWEDPFASKAHKYEVNAGIAANEPSSGVIQDMSPVSHGLAKAPEKEEKPVAASSGGSSSSSGGGVETTSLNMGLRHAPSSNETKPAPEKAAEVEAGAVEETKSMSSLMDFWKSRQ